MVNKRRFQKSDNAKQVFIKLQQTNNNKNKVTYEKQILITPYDGYHVIRSM